MDVGIVPWYSDLARLHSGFSWRTWLESEFFNRPYLKFARFLSALLNYWITPSAPFTTVSFRIPDDQIMFIVISHSMLHTSANVTALFSDQRIRTIYMGLDRLLPYSFPACHLCCIVFNAEVKWLAVGRSRVHISVWILAVLTEVFRDFPHSLQESAEIVS